METNERGPLPILPLKTCAVLPSVVVPLIVGRPASVAALEAASTTPDKEILLVAQRDPETAEPRLDDLYEYGTRALLRRTVLAPGGAAQVIVHGVERVRLTREVQIEPFLSAQYVPAPAKARVSTESEALVKEIEELVQKVLTLNQSPNAASLTEMRPASADPMATLYIYVSILDFDGERVQKILEAPTLLEASRLLHKQLRHEVEVLEVRREISKKAESEMGKQQREFVLRQQLKAIREELGETDAGPSGHEQLTGRLAAADLPDRVRKEVERELARLSQVPASSPEHGLIRTYVELVLDLPWKKRSEDSLDLARARAVMDEDHLGLGDVKDRIIEQLAMLKLNPEAKAPILCFVGPPGVGKTSLGRSVARALSRSFERISLGGLHDEAELRGHRRTYVGAMPGRIVQAIRRAGVANPVLMFDEIDKLGRDFRGDPAAAMLEILDPEQNSSFHDNYLDLDFDLSKVFFITTANSLETIPPPLRDRMEILPLTGYSEEEKLHIARKYLLPRQLHQAGLKDEQCRFTDEALGRLIRTYTREAGVRQLERTIGRIVRKAAVRFAQAAAGSGSAAPVEVAGEELAEWLGPEVFHLDPIRRTLPAGVATGLAWTESGGDVISVETALLPGDRGLTLTGQLGDVMQESVRAAQTYLWAHARELGMDPVLFRKNTLHVHVPAGAVPKDGPSAGVTMATAMASLFSGRAVRPDTAMTGEVTITGLVLPVGGIKEKVLAARRAGLTRVILPRQNESSLRELPAEVSSSMEFVLVDRIEEVLAAALPPAPEKPLIPPRERGTPAPDVRAVCI